MRPASTAATTIGGVLAGLEQQIMRRQPPPEELVEHARPDAPVPAAGGWLIQLPGVAPDGDPPDCERGTGVDPA